MGVDTKYLNYSQRQWSRLCLSVLTSRWVSDGICQTTSKDHSNKLLTKICMSHIVDTVSHQDLTSNAPNTTAIHAINMPDVLTTSDSIFPQPFGNEFAVVHPEPAAQQESGILLEAPVQSAAPLLPQHCRPRWIPLMASVLAGSLLVIMLVQSLSNPFLAASASVSVYMKA